MLNPIVLIYIYNPSFLALYGLKRSAAFCICALKAFWTSRIDISFALYNALTPAGRILTLNTVWAQQMRSLQVTTCGALVQCCSILLSVVVHEAMALLHVRSLLLWDSAQDGLPQASERCWDIERDSGWDGEGERGDRWNGELSREHDGRASEGGSGWRGEAWEEGGEDGSGGGVDGRHCKKFSIGLVGVEADP